MSSASSSSLLLRYKTKRCHGPSKRIVAYLPHLVDRARTHEGGGGAAPAVVRPRVHGVAAAAAPGVPARSRDGHATVEVRVVVRRRRRLRVRQPPRAGRGGAALFVVCSA